MTDYGDRYYSYSRYLKETVGHQLYPVPIDLGFGCPNRAADGTGGCTFCPANGARARQTLNAESIEEQIHDAIQFSKRRYNAKHFMAYIQAFTGTFAPTGIQRDIYNHILSIFPFESVSIGTRPDCLKADTIEFINELQQRLDVRVELGIQTVHDATLERINRGHDWHCSREAIFRLDQAGIPVIAHAILGLPGETPEDFNVTAERLAECPLDGIKLHNLHIVKDSPLAKEYLAAPFPLLNEYDYLDALIDFLRRLPPTLPVLRVVTDSPEDDLIAPDWSMSKGQFLEQLNRHLFFKRRSQGDLYIQASHDNQDSGSPETFSNEAIHTDDGSVTFWSPIFKEHYHTTVGAEAESVKKYIEPSGILDGIQSTRYRILDVCFGLGYNSLAAIHLLTERPTAPGLDIIGLELDRGVVKDAADQSSHPVDKAILNTLYQSDTYRDSHVEISMLWGDARHTVTKARETGLFDFIFLDAFSTQRNSELWNVDFFKKLFDLMAPNGKVLTYCAALPVRAGLLEAGFAVGNTPAFGRDRSGTMACRDHSLINSPLDQQELDNITKTSKGIPYRDPTGTGTNREILKRREDEIRAFKKQG